MKIYHHIDEFTGAKNPVLTTGTYDGVHIGHRTIIKRLQQIAKRVDGETVLLTFHPHPRVVLYQDEDLRLINTQNEKIELLREAGIDHLIIHPFSKEFSRITSMEYIRDIIANMLKVHTLVIGYNHHFGRNREGSFEHLMQYSDLYGFQVEEIPAQDMDDINVSSTKVRNALQLGDIETANKYLTTDFEIEGLVVKGDQIGRTIGYPTANLQIDDPYKLIPAEGVYITTAVIDDKEWPCMLNIGKRPTIHQDGELRIEAHILDYNGDLYEQNLRLKFKSYLREDQSFGSLDELKQQIAKDEKATRAYFI